MQDSGFVIGPRSPRFNLSAKETRSCLEAVVPNTGLGFRGMFVCLSDGVQVSEWVPGRYEVKLVGSVPRKHLLCEVVS